MNILGNATSPCYARHMGLWAIEPRWFCSALSAVKAGLYRTAAGHGPHDPGPPQIAHQAAMTDRKPYPVQQGVAVIEVAGPLMKGGGSYGEVDSVAVRRQLRAASRDEEVGAIMILLDSPGGTVAGTEELADDVSSAATAKPTFAHMDDLGASAAYWMASQVGPGRLSANASAQVGSIGILAVVEDLSKMAEAEGIKVHVVSTGAFKGVGTPGTEILPEHLEYMQGIVDKTNALFLAAVKAGRGVSAKTVEGWADGRVWLAEEARSMGLIDRVQSFDSAMEQARKAIPKKSSARSAAALAVEGAIWDAELAS